MSLVVARGTTLRVDGTVELLGGNIQNEGIILVTSGDTLRANGVFNNLGNLTVTATGRVVVNSFYPYESGTMNLTGGAEIRATRFQSWGDTGPGTFVPPDGWKVSSPDSAGYCTLRYAGSGGDASGTQGNIKWDYKSGILTISGTGPMDDYAASNRTPWYSYKGDITTVKIGSGVTTIGDYVFYGCSQLTGVTIPESVTSIGSQAFEYCTALTGITLPNSVTSIGKYAFSGCNKLASINIPDRVTGIGEGVFRGCSKLTGIHIPDSVTTIGLSAFDQAGLTQVTIPAGVTGIGNSAFSMCKSLASVTFAGGSKLNSIGASAFSNCSALTGITLPDSVKSIGVSAFDWCTGLERVNIPSGVTVIEQTTFNRCEKLASIAIPESVTIIGERAFSGCYALTTITFEGTQEKWGTVTKGTGAIPSTITVSCSDGPYTTPDTGGGSGIDGNISWAYNSGTLTISGTGTMNNYSPANLAPWGNHGSEIETVVIESGVTSIGASAFYQCKSLTEITIPASVETIGNRAFASCFKLTTINFTGASNLKSIEEYAFIGCSGLVTVAIPASVSSIGAGPFAACSSLTQIQVPQENADYCSENGVLFDKNKQTLIMYPGGKERNYTVPDGVKTIGARAFNSCYKLAAVTIPDSVETISSYAFIGCSQLTTVNFTGVSNLKSIGEGAFSTCSQLQSVSIPATVTSIGQQAFVDCTALTTITFKGTQEQWNVLSVTLPSSVTVTCTGGSGAP